MRPEDAGGRCPGRCGSGPAETKPSHDRRRTVTGRRYPCSRPGRRRGGAGFATMRHATTGDGHARERGRRTRCGLTGQCRHGRATGMTCPPISSGSPSWRSPGGASCAAARPSARLPSCWARAACAAPGADAPQRRASSSRRSPPTASTPSPCPRASAGRWWRAGAIRSGPTGRPSTTRRAAPAASQERAFGDNCDGMALFAREGRSVLAVNNEYTNLETAFANRASGRPESEDDVRKCKAAHGVSVFEIAQRGRRLGDRPGFAHEPPHHPRHADGDHRPCARPRHDEDRRRPRGHGCARHLEQLRQRAHALGHLPRLRGELQRLLLVERSPTWRCPPASSATASSTRTGATAGP